MCPLSHFCLSRGANKMDSRCNIKYFNTLKFIANFVNANSELIDHWHTPSDLLQFWPKIWCGLLFVSRCTRVATVEHRVTNFIHPFLYTAYHTGSWGTWVYPRRGTRYPGYTLNKMPMYRRAQSHQYLHTTRCQSAYNAAYKSFIWAPGGSPRGTRRITTPHTE